MKRSVFSNVLSRLKEKRRFIQVLLGPRQVGKTTLALQIAKEIKKPTHYISADLVTLQDISWLEQEWEIARQMVDEKVGALLIIDEIQKVPNWSQMIKSLWDKDSKKKINLHVLILGSSPWLVQKGLTESLAGRFEIIPITHWSYIEMKESFNFDLSKYIFFGGYPGASFLANDNDLARFRNYINDSLIETTISRDILLMTQVNKPALLRRLFQLGCLYSGQILSYTKMLGELQDAGNTTTLAHYLDLLSGSGLVAGIQKFAIEEFRQKSSTPKLCVYNTALLTAQSNKTFKEALEDKAYWGKMVESMIGAHLLNNIRGTNIELFYWREKDVEVDFILRQGKSTVAIEVKSSTKPHKTSGLDLFTKKFHPIKTLVIGNEKISTEKFLETPLINFFK